MNENYQEYYLQFIKKFVDNHHFIGEQTYFLGLSRDYIFSVI